MNRMAHRWVVALGFAIVSSITAASVGPVGAQENPPPVPVTLPCAENISVQVLGRIPHEDGTDIALVRIVWGPGGSIGAHTHPGLMWVTVESGQLGVTQLEGEPMPVTRAATADAEATQEALVVDVETVLEAGDGFVEMGMVHSARNMSSDEAMTTIFAAVVTTGEPLTTCVDTATPAATPAASNRAWQGM